MEGHNELFCKRCVGTNPHRMMTAHIALCDVCNWMTYVPSQEDFVDHGGQGVTPTEKLPADVRQKSR